MNSAHRDYFSNFIAENCSNQRKLFRTTNSLLFEPISFPDHIPMIWLIIFATILYRIKIERINDSLDALQSSEPLTAMAMRPQIIWAHAQTVLILIRANV